MAVIVDETTTGQLADFADAVEDTCRYICEGFLDSRRRFAALRLSILAVDVLDQNGFCGRTPAISRENDLELVRIDLGHRVVHRLPPQ